MSRSTTSRRPLAAAAILLACALAPASSARDVPRAPSTYVLDEADWLDAAVEQRLSRDLLQYERETSNQIVVAVMRSLDGEDLADFSQRVAESWGIGQKERSNGILLAIYVEERMIDIEVGYGLEPVVTDAIANEIRTGILVPALREGRPAEGISDAVHALQAAARGEFEGTGRARSDEERRPGPPPGVIVILVIIIALMAARARRSRGMVFGPPGWGPDGRGFRTMRHGGLGGPGGFGGFGGSRGGGGGFRGGGG
ncbi:MAG: TPM domain-containing protein, partial [bacterium]